MANRVKLDDQVLENVSGGAFNFYNKDGKAMCYIDGVGTYYCSAEASSWIISQITGSESPASIVAGAVDKGLLWK